MTYLHDNIMNLQLDQDYSGVSKDQVFAYKVGHREARHAAAELAIPVEQRNKELESALREMTDMWRTVCDANGWDPDHMAQYEKAIVVLKETES